MKFSNRLFTPLILTAVLLLAGCPPQEKSLNSNTVVIWHWMTDREEAFLELARRYKEKTGVDVQFQLYAPSDAYTAEVRVGAQTNSLPEIFGVLGAIRDLASYISSGHVAKLDEDLVKNNWQQTFYKAALDSVYFKEGNSFDVSPGYYGIPLDVTTIPMIYNKKLFQKAGLDPNKPPATWDEFIDAGQKLRKVGVSGFVSGWGETWLIYSLATDLAVNVMGEEKMMQTFEGKVPYTDPDWIKVFDAFEKLQKGGFVDPSIVTLENKNSEKSFSTERAGMTFNGSWAVNVYAGMNPNLEYAPFAPPAISKNFPRSVWGGAGTAFNVNAKSPNKELAVDFLRWFTEPAQAAYLLEKTRNLPSVKIEGVKVAPVLKEFADLMKDSIHPNRFRSSEDPRVVEAFNKGIQSILIAEKTPVEVGKKIQEMKVSVSKTQS